LPTIAKVIEEDETGELPLLLTDELETPEGDEMATDEEEMLVSGAELLLTPEELTLLEVKGQLLLREPPLSQWSNFPSRQKPP
jgi:hypothetical protein